MSVFALSSIVFVGKSFIPPGGGHNIIEPAILSKPVLFGPFMDNFKDVARDFLLHLAAIQVHSREELEEKLLNLLKSDSEREQLGKRARQFVLSQQGVLQKNISILERFLKHP